MTKKDFMENEEFKVQIGMKPSFFMLPTLVHDREEINVKARQVYSFLCFCASEGEDFPSKNKIMKACSMGKATVSKALKELEDFGLLEMEIVQTQNNEAEAYYTLCH